MGTDDLVVSESDSHWIKDQLGPEIVVEYLEIPGGHLQFMVGTDASYWTKNAMNLI